MIDQSSKMHRPLCCLLLLCILAKLGQNESYIPPYVEGIPSNGKVVSTVPPDLRGDILYRIEHEVISSSSPIMALVHRTYAEFVTLDEKIRDDFWLTNPTIALPSDPSVASLNEYLQVIYEEESIRESTLMADFLSINWNGKDITFMYDLTGFLEMLLFARVPNFMPEPPRIEKDSFLADGEPQFFSF